MVGVVNNCRGLGAHPELADLTNLEEDRPLRSQGSDFPKSSAIDHIFRSNAGSKDETGKHFCSDELSSLIEIVFPESSKCSTNDFLFTVQEMRNVFDHNFFV